MPFQVSQGPFFPIFFNCLRDVELKAFAKSRKLATT